MPWELPFITVIFLHPMNILALLGNNFGIAFIFKP